MILTILTDLALYDIQYCLFVDFWQEASVVATHALCWFKHCLYSAGPRHQPPGLLISR